MKYAACWLVAASLALMAHGDVPTGAEGWYTPPRGFAAQSGSGTVWYFDNNGNEQHETVSVDAFGMVSGGITVFDGFPELKTAYEALVKACWNEAYNKKQDEAIDTIGKNLYNMVHGGLFVDYVDTDGGAKSVKVMYSPPAEGQQAAGREDKLSSGRVRGDGLTVVKASDGTLSLRGAGGAAASQDDWWSVQGGAFFVPFLPAGGDALGWKRYEGFRVDSDVFEDVAASTGGKFKLGLAGFRDDSQKCDRKLADILTEEDDADREAHSVLARYGTGKDAVFHYIPFGARLRIDAPPPDGVSVVTNAADGAEADGALSLANWKAQGDYAIPYKYNGQLFWKTPDQWADGASVAWEADGAGNMRLGVSGASAYGGTHARHYFGTSQDGSASIGWHELPNVTTNAVEGDEVTVSSYAAAPGAPEGGDAKTLGLKGWAYGHGGPPLFLANVSGALAYLPFEGASTNACPCTNRWADLCAWIGDASADGDGLDLPGDTLAGRVADLGFVGSTGLTKPAFSAGADGAVAANFAAPGSWADGESVEAKEGKYQIKGFSSAAVCDADISSMLSDPDGADAKTHLVLAKKTDTGKLHYVPLGGGVRGGVAFVGTDGSTATGNVVRAEAMEDSCVKLVVGVDNNGTVVLKVGAYYR